MNEIQFLSAFERIFLPKLEERSNWGKNQVRSMFVDAKTEYLEQLLEEARGGSNGASQNQE